MILSYRLPLLGLHRMVYFGAIFCMLGIFSLHAEPPLLTVDAISRPVAQIGTTVEVRVLGSNTQDVDQLIFSHPGIRGELLELPPLPLDDVPQKNFGTFRVTVDSTVPVGVYEVHCVGRYGVSNPKNFVVVDTSVESIPEPTPDGKPMELKTGVTYLGRTKATDRHKFRISSHPLESHVYCSALIVDSQALPKITLKNLAGKTIRTNRNSTRLPVSLSCPANEELHLELHDELFRGGDAFPFLLCINPPPSHPLLLNDFSLPASSVISAVLPSWPIITAEPARIVEMTAPQELQFRNGSTFIAKIQAEPQSQIECQVISNCMGQASDYRLVPFQSMTADGQLTGQILVAEDGPALGTKGVSLSHLDPTAQWTVPETLRAGFYVLVQGLQTRSTDLLRPIRLRVGPPIPRFSCIAHFTPWTNAPTQSRITGGCLSRGGKLPIHVVVLRQGGFVGPVEIAAESLPAGLSCPRVTLQSNQNETDLLITASDDAPSWIGPLNLSAHAIVHDMTVSVSIPSATVWRSASKERGLPQSRLTNALWIKITEDLAPISMDVKGDMPLKVKAGDKLNLSIAIKRRPGGEAKLQLRPQNLPPKVTIPEGEIAANVDNTEREITTAVDTPPGEYNINFQGEMTWKQPLHPESYTRHVAYRDRLQAKLTTTQDPNMKTALEGAIAEANKQIDQLAKETAPRDFPVFFYTADFRLLVEKP